METHEGSDVGTYFGYGTLLGTAAMRDYCPSARAVAVARYPGHRLAFRQYSDDATRSGCTVRAVADWDLWGVVYEMDAAELRALDVASGVDRGWFRRFPITVLAADGSAIETTTYELTAPGPDQDPGRDYVGLVRTGAAVAGLPASYVARLTAWLDEVERDA
jgi:hypothetical protein